MSRIGKKPIVVPENVDVKIEGNTIKVKGPKGELERTFVKEINVELKDGVINVTKSKDIKQLDGLHGLTRTLINNMVEGVVNEFTKKLEINGVGYKVQKQGTKLVLALGYSHPVEVEAPAGITFDVEGNNKITVRGIDKQLVGQIAANIREKRPPEVYRGKGIKYDYEVIRRKEGKTGK
ncbi:MAG: 50S ribosomal protein L6 [Clostridium sp.]